MLPRRVQLTKEMPDRSDVISLLMPPPEAVPAPRPSGPSPRGARNLFHVQRPRWLLKVRHHAPARADSFPCAQPRSEVLPLASFRQTPDLERQPDSRNTPAW